MTIKKIISIILLSLCFFTLFSKEKPESNLYLQDIPMLEGIDNFSARLEKIKTEEGREPLGLLLCGGSARAFCHVGVLRALEENEIRPDFIVANSMGAIIGLLYSYGFSPDKIEEIIKKINIPSYFDLVMPIHGGFISVRNYEALINELLDEESHDIKDCEIPILILTEDLYTKRQIWFAQGDFATVMNAAFSMPVFMEPVKATLSDGTKVLQTDAGTLDIGGISIAKQFSENLLISTAFYDTALNYNSPIVIINRTFSIGKERITIRDIKNTDAVMIRNDVENFSFMAFDKFDEIQAQGYSSAMAAMEQIKKCPHGFKIDKKRREITDNLTNNLINKISHNQNGKISHPYFGVKIWPQFTNIDFEDFYIYNQDSIYFSSFIDFPILSISAGISYPIGTKRLDAKSVFSLQSELFESRLEALYSCNFSDYSKNLTYFAGMLGYKPQFLPPCFNSFYCSTELLYERNSILQDFNSNVGLKFKIGNYINNFLFLKPYLFLSGNNFKTLSYGFAGELQSSVNISKHFGIGDSGSVRYAAGNFSEQTPAVARLYCLDFYRDEKPVSETNFVATNAFEIFYKNTDLGITVAEFIIFKQCKIGGFFDFAYNNQFSYCTGGFLRTQISFIGLSDFIFEGGGGYNLSSKNLFYYLSMKKHL